MILLRLIENRVFVVCYSWLFVFLYVNVVLKLLWMNKFCFNWYVRFNMCIIIGNYVLIFFYLRDESKNGKLGIFKLKLNRVIIEIVFKRMLIWLLYFLFCRNDCIFFLRGKEIIILFILGIFNLNWRCINFGRSFCKGIIKKGLWGI